MFNDKQSILPSKLMVFECLDDNDNITVLALKSNVECGDKRKQSDMMNGTIANDNDTKDASTNDTKVSSAKKPKSKKKRKSNKSPANENVEVVANSERAADGSENEHDLDVHPRDLALLQDSSAINSFDVATATSLRKISERLSEQEHSKEAEAANQSDEPAPDEGKLEFDQPEIFTNISLNSPNRSDHSDVIPGDELANEEPEQSAVSPDLADIAMEHVRDDEVTEEAMPIVEYISEVEATEEAISVVSSLVESPVKFTVNKSPPFTRSAKNKTKSRKSMGMSRAKSYVSLTDMAMKMDQNNEAGDTVSSVDSSEPLMIEKLDNESSSDSAISTGKSSKKRSILTALTQEGNLIVMKWCKYIED